MVEKTDFQRACGKPAVIGELSWGAENWEYRKNYICTLGVDAPGYFNARGYCLEHGRELGLIW